MNGVKMSDTTRKCTKKNVKLTESKGEAKMLINCTTFEL